MSYFKVEVNKLVLAERVDRLGQSRTVSYQAGERIGGVLDVCRNEDEDGNSLPGHIVYLDNDGYISFPEGSIYYEN